MITRIELKNFMSHVHTVIEPAPGLTVLVGPNNCGKSAVVAALQILAHNDNSTYVLRHGEKECSVKVTTSDGHTIEWRRKNSPSYVIDGQLFDRLRGVGLPEELHSALRLPTVDGGDGQFDVHFGEQKSPIFLLDQSSATAAKFFSSSSDAGRLLQMQRRHKEKHVQRQREKNRLEAESRQLNAELEALLPAVDLDELLQAVERLHDALAQEAVWLTQAESDQAALVGLHQTVARHAAQSQSLAPLAAPPELTFTESLEDLAAKMELAEVDQSRSDARLATLARLPMPPSLEDEVGLAATIDGLHKWDTAADRERATQKSLLALQLPPALADTADLASLVDRLTAAVLNSDEAAARQQALTGITPPPGLSDERSLADLVERFTSAEQHREHWQEVASASAIGPPEMPQDWQPLESCVVQLERAADQSSHLTTELTTASAALMAAETALREFAASEVCPTCGSQLDADRLITGAALSGASLPGGRGGHDHG